MKAKVMTSENLEEFFRGLMEGRNEETLTKEKVKEKITEMHRNMPQIVRNIFDTNDLKKGVCGHPEHGIWPANGRDWRAVDNFMVGIWAAYTEHATAYIETLDTVVRNLEKSYRVELHPSVRLQIAEVDMHTTLLFTILDCHFRLIHDLGRDNPDADLHYDRIINQAVPIVERYSKRKENKNAESGDTDRQDVPDGAGDKKGRKSNKGAKVKKK